MDLLFRIYLSKNTRWSKYRPLALEIATIPILMYYDPKTKARFFLLIFVPLIRSKIDVLKRVFWLFSGRGNIRRASFETPPTHNPPTWQYLLLYQKSSAWVVCRRRYGHFTMKRTWRKLIKPEYIDDMSEMSLTIMNKWIIPVLTLNARNDFEDLRPESATFRHIKVIILNVLKEKIYQIYFFIFL